MRAIGFQLMSHRRMAMRRFGDTRELCPYPGLTRTLEIAAFAISTCKKTGHKCQFSTRKSFHWVPTSRSTQRKVFSMNVGTKFAVSTGVMNKNSQILRPRQKLSLGDLILAVSSCTRSSRETVATVADLLGSGQVRVEDHGRFLRAKVC